MRLLLAGLIAAPVLGVLAGCALESGAGVAPEVLAEQVSRSLERSVGRPPDDVTCLDELPARVGAEVRCTLVDGEATYGVTVRTTAVEGDDVRFDVQVDQEPQP